MNETTFEEWFEEVKRIARDYGWTNPDKQLGSGESWKDYYNEGYTPKDALDEDISYA